MYIRTKKKTNINLKLYSAHKNQFIIFCSYDVLTLRVKDENYN